MTYEEFRKEVLHGLLDHLMAFPKEEVIKFVEDNETRIKDNYALE